MAVAVQGASKVKVGCFTWAFVLQLSLSLTICLSSFVLSVLLSCGFLCFLHAFGVTALDQNSVGMGWSGLAFQLYAEAADQQKTAE